jgi:hypothetical protein
MSNKQKTVDANALAKDHIKRASGGLPGGLSDPFELETMIAKSIVSIDKFFGDGFAQKNPTVVAASITACARLDSCVHGNIEDALNSVANALGMLAEAAEKTG